MPRRAFTLIELLVVISLITLLISMTLPSLGKSKTAARTTICLTSLNQMAIGTDAYTVDNKGFYPPYDNVNNLRYDTFWMTVYDRYHGDDRVRDCPETVENPRVWGTSKIRWGPAPGSFIGEHTGSYGWNSWMHSGTTAGNQHSYYGRRDKPKQQSATPLFADSSWVDFWPRVTDGWPGSGVQMGSQAGESSMGRVTVDRHDMKVNVVMVDSSAHTFRFGDLWEKLYWHVGYKPAPGPPMP